MRESLLKRLLLLLLLSACSSGTVIEPTTSTSISTTTVVTTTSTIVTTTTTVVRNGYCPQWHELALSVGWPEEELPTLDKVLWRESRCMPNARNGGNFGLTQINHIHKEWVNSMGWDYPNDLFNPEKNLYFAYLLWADDGWKHWKTASR